MAIRVVAGHGGWSVTTLPLYWHWTLGTLGLLVECLHTDPALRIPWLQTAMKLWKVSGNGEYVFWIALGINAQVAEDGPNPSLNLAELMMRKVLDSVCYQRL